MNQGTEEISEIFEEESNYSLSKTKNKRSPKEKKNDTEDIKLGEITLKPKITIIFNLWLDQHILE